MQESHESKEHNEEPKAGGGLNVFEKYLTVWVGLCILGGILLGRLAPGLAEFLDGIAIYVDDAPVISIPGSPKVPSS